MSYEQVMENLSGSSAAEMGKLLNSFYADDITRGEFLRLAASLVQAANAKAGTVAGLAMHADIDRQLGMSPAIDRAAESRDERKRIIAGLETMLSDYVAGDSDSAERLAMRAKRLASTEPFSAAVYSMDQTLLFNTSRLVGWQRGLNTGACELCEHLARNGEIFPVTANMADHVNCRCWKKPATK